jgi:hypothetical protein
MALLGLLLAVGLSSAACAPAHRASRTPVVTSWDYAADRPAVWSAALDALRMIDFTVEEVDEAAAEIVTAWRQLDPGTGYTTCTQPYEGRVRLRFGSGVQGVRVTMNVEFRIQAGEPAYRCPSSGELERQLNRLILDHLPTSGFTLE